MGRPFQNRRTRYNPIEAFVLLVVLGLFAHSAYRLLFDWKGVNETHKTAELMTSDIVYKPDGSPAFDIHKKMKSNEKRAPAAESK